VSKLLFKKVPVEICLFPSFRSEIDKSITVTTETKRYLWVAKQESDMNWKFFVLFAIISVSLVAACDESTLEVSVEDTFTGDVASDAEPDEEDILPLTCEEEVFLFYQMDSDEDGMVNQSDLYPCCHGELITQGDFVLRFYEFLLNKMNIDCSEPVQVFDNVGPDSEYFEALSCLNQWGLYWASGEEFQAENRFPRDEFLIFVSSGLHLTSASEGWEERIPFDDVAPEDFPAHLVMEFVEAGLIPTHSNTFGAEEQATECIYDVFDRACELGYCTEGGRICEEEQSVHWFDSDGDGVKNYLDDYPCCNEPLLTRGELAQRLSNFGEDNLGMTCDISGTSFTDIVGHPAEDAINCIIGWGVMDGYVNGTFGPDNFINRAEAAKILAELLLLENNVLPSDWLENLPDDVSGDEWFAEPVAKLISTHLAPRQEIFRPAENATSCFIDGVLGSACALGYCGLTRADGFITVVEALQLQCDLGAPHFTDIPEDHIAYEAVECAFANNLISGQIDANGNPVGTIGPDITMTRQEVIKLLVEGLDLPIYVGTEVAFTDVPEGLWSYQFIMTAVENGLLTTGGEFNPQFFASPQWLNLILARARAQNLLP